MPRAHNIYLVVNAENDICLAAFTVKWECVAYIERHGLEGYLIDRWRVRTLRDGQDTTDFLGVPAPEFID